MLTPAHENLIAYIGGTFERTIELWADAAHTEPYDLTGWTVKFVVVGKVTLTSGSGLTITAEGGKIEAEMTPEQTAKVTKPVDVRYYLSMEKGGKTYFPLDGLMRYEEP